MDKKSVEGERAVRLCNYVDVYKNDLITADMPFMEATATAGQIERFGLKAGDVLITKDSEAWDDIAVPALVPADLDGILCGYHLAHIRTRPDVMLGRFLARAFSAEGIADQFRVAANGITRFGIGMDEISGAMFPVPPLDEQHAIADYLDRKTAEIDALIAGKRRMIDLLHEKRQALISEAVTKGLDPDVPMKDSGIDWMSQVPANWQLVKLKYVARVQSGVTLGKKYGGTPLVSHPYLRVANVQDGYLDLNEITTIDLPPDEAIRYKLRPGDVLMTEGGDFDKLGRGYVWDCQIADCLHQNHVFAVRPNKNRLRSHFLSSLMTSAHGKNYFTSTAQQTTNLATTNSTKLGAFTLPVPPVTEQDQILAFLADCGSRLEGATQKLKVSIDKLLEFRRTLISAAVTGKIDVRQEVT